MKPKTPIFASDVTAARLLDLRTSQFIDLVRQGHLPPGREIAPGVLRWNTEDLRRISDGERSDVWGGIDW